MKRTFLSVMSFALILLATSVSAQNWASDPELRELKAFPGAEGFGRNVSGGRGGRVVAVTSLADNGTGTLRWALSQHSGQPITVVFRVSGIINLTSDLRVKRDNYTIAGQTSPSGIMITGSKVNLGGSNNFIVRHVRFRIGTMNNDPDGKAALGVENATRFIIDHCTFGWAGEENMTMYDNDSSTVQWSIVHESLYQSGHNKGVRGYATQWGGQRATYHHNLLAHHNSRMPRFNGARSNDIDVLMEYVNNVHYNWTGANSPYGGDIQNNSHRVNFVGNYYKPGPARPGTQSSNFIRASFHANQATSGRIALWHMSGNHMEGSANTNRNSDNYNGLNAGDYTSRGIEASRLRSTSEFNIPEQYRVTRQTAAQAYTSVLARAGAWPRDAVDTRIVSEVQNGTASGSGSFNNRQANSGIIDNPSAVGGNPTYSNPAAPVDTDGDGIPDAWEIANGLNPNNANDGNATSLSGTYTNLEVYLHDRHRSLLPGYTPPTPTPSAIVTAPANNSIFMPGQTINITATASVPSGTISRVEFFNGSTRLGESTTAPYTFAWTNPPAGIHSVTARATSGTTTGTSAAVAVTVGSPIETTSDIIDKLILFDTNATRWSVNSNFGSELKAYGDREFLTGSVPANLQGAEWISVAMTSRTLKHTITQFEMKTDAVVNLLHENRVATKPAWIAAGGFVSTGQTVTVIENASTTRTFTHYAKNAKQGETIMMGINSNDFTTSSMMYLIAFSVSNNPPTATITAPTNNTMLLPGQPVTITATAADSDGTVAKVEFLNGTEKIGESTTAPYSFTWVDPPSGVHSITARAIDNDGGAGASEAVTVLVGKNIGSGTFIDNLILFDIANDTAWSVAQDFSAGSKVFGDRAFALGDVIPENLQGAEWISSSMVSRTVDTLNPIVQFTMKSAGVVTLLYEDRVTEKPEWVEEAGFVAVDASEQVSVSDGNADRTFTAYTKDVKVGDIVKLGPNSIDGTTTSMMYLIVFTESGATPVLNAKSANLNLSIFARGKTLFVEVGSPTVLDIFDLSGKKVASYNVLGTSQTLHLNLQSGVYFAKARSMQSVKFVVR
ncbi:MAG: hypothetical protein LBU89_13970 [Fibromonadaceae bacterium]|jgi:pectate lyase|nr:hypothetical protein [Fibromonadaceae bacterium]